MTDTLVKIPCEACGEESITFTQDLEEGAPEGRWRTWKRLGDPHPLCEKHRRPAMQHRRDGFVIPDPRMTW